MNLVDRIIDLEVKYTTRHPHKPNTVFMSVDRFDQLFEEVKPVLTYQQQMEWRYCSRMIDTSSKEKAAVYGMLIRLVPGERILAVGRRKTWRESKVPKGVPEAMEQLGQIRRLRLQPS